MTSPFKIVNLNGEGLFRSLTLALPTEDVRRLIPWGLELGPQDVTPPGTHPVVMLYNDLFRAHMSVPSLLPSLTYHEHTVGVPFTYVTGGVLPSGGPGPYYWMPILYLNSFLAILGGRLFWGFEKIMATFDVTPDRYTISAMGGRRVTTLRWEEAGEYRPVSEEENFEPIRRMLDQPLISMVPGGLGPFFVASHFDKHWPSATLRPIRTSLEIGIEYVQGLSGGKYPARGKQAGLDQDVLGSYELRAPWLLSMPYPPLPGW